MIRKNMWRLIPLLFLCYIIAYIDRINVGFAGLQLRQTFGVDEELAKAIFAHGSGIFFIGYFIFEVPSNLILQRVGARMWIARIMVVWGLVSAAMMFVKTPQMFYVMRFLLGVAEAGFFPGIILYLTYWFPAKDRARMIAMFAAAGTLAGIVGSPISGKLLELNGCGLSGWQWLFLLEGIPAVLVGLLVFFILPDRPAQARWLSSDEKHWLQTQLDAEARQLAASKKHRLRDAFANPQVWLLCAIYFLLNVCGYGLEMWLPQILRKFSGYSEFKIGLLNAIPYLVATVAMVLAGRHSDRTGERRWHVCVAALIGAAGFALSALTGHFILSLALLAIGFAGQKSMLGPFWALGSALLTGTAAAGGIALINSVGNLGGYAGPKLVGWLAQAEGYQTAMLGLGGALFLLSILTSLLRAERPQGLTEAPVASDSIRVEEGRS
ncbi:MAG TPA: MFS transporter [Planctomycetota bacterium]